MGEFANVQDQVALGEMLWALAGGGGAYTKIASAIAITRNNFIGTPGCQSIPTHCRRVITTAYRDKCVAGSRPARRVFPTSKVTQ